MTSDRVDDILAEWRRERPDLDVSAMGVIGRVHRLADVLDRELTGVFAAVGLSRGEFDVLAALRRAGAPHERTAGELAASTMVTTGGLTKRIDRLESRGLVRRAPDGGDARRRVIGLTAAGLALVDEAVAAHVANEQRLVAALGDPDALAGVLRGWLLALGED